MRYQHTRSFDIDVSPIVVGSIGFHTLLANDVNQHYQSGPFAVIAVACQ
jgi:hypothetical protein